jgi:hypothetical protein
MYTARRERRTDGECAAGGTLNGVPANVVQAGYEAFVYSLQNGLRLGAGVALAGAIAAWTLVGRRQPRRPAPAIMMAWRPAQRTSSSRPQPV